MPRASAPGPFSWPLYLALRQLFPTGKRFPFFTLISILGVALGVAMLVVTLGVMGGFGNEIRRMITDTSGELQVTRLEGLLQEPEALLAQLEADPAVAGATPSALGGVVVHYERKPAQTSIQGIDVDTIARVVPLDRYMIAGRLDDLDDDTVILSAELARSLGVHLRDKVLIYSPLLLEKYSRGDEAILPAELTVVGIFEIGHNQLDKSVALCTLRTMQDLYGLGTAVHAINVRLKPRADVDGTANRLQQGLPDGLRVSTWIETFHDFMFIVQLEKNLLFFLLLIIVVVAAFSVTSSLLISVIRKTREIGLLGALGGSSRQVAWCFCWQGLLIGAFGTLCGVGLGYTLLHFRNHIINGFVALTDSRRAMNTAYGFYQLPAYLSPRDLTLIVASSIAIATLAGLLPAWRAARLNPSEALRSE